LVIASPNAVPNTVPSASDYAIAGNSNLFTSTSLGNGKVVYNGIGNAVNLINLDYGTTYYFHIYEYRLTAGVYEVNTTTPQSIRLSTSQTTPPAFPTIAPSNPVYTTADYHRISLSWTKGNGNYSYVVASKDAAPNTAPGYFDFNKASNSAFGLGDALGNGFVVCNGPFNSITLTNLTSSTNYYFHIYEYNILNSEFTYDTSVKLATNRATTALLAPTLISSGPVTMYNAYLPSTNVLGGFSNKGNGDGRMVVSRLSSDPVSIPSNNTVYKEYNASISPALNWSVGNGKIMNILGFDGGYFNISNITAGSNLCFDVFEFNGNIDSGQAVFNTTPFTYCYKSPQPFSPTVGATNPVFSNITTNSLNFSWTKGSGNRRIVIARKDSLPRAINTTDFSTNTDSRSYNGNSVFGSGPAVGGGYVVYNGIDDNVTITNLQSNGNYYFHVYEMNEYYYEISNTYYAVTNRLSTNVTVTPVAPAAPTVGATNINFSSVTQNSINLTWTKGNGTHRIVIAKQGSAETTNPEDGFDYAGNTLFGEGSQIGTGYVVYDGTGNSVEVTGLTAATKYYFTIIEYNLGETTILYATSSKTSSNQTTSSSESGVDTDNDGVVDSQDDYPNDAYKAFNNNYPAEGNGTLMFEDLWPATGDYDFNDLVLDYNFNVVTNASNQVIEAKYTFYTKAIGGGLNNGFAFQLDGIPASKIISVTGTKTSGISYTSMNSNGTEAGQTTANIVVIKNASDLLPHSAGFAFVNVEADAPNVGMDTTIVTIKFAENGVFAVEETPIAIADFSSSIFNPYLIVGQQRGKEIHLADRTPSALASLSYFGQQQDASNSSTQTYYKTATGLPWALNISQSIPQAIEKTDFTEVYLNFANWANGGGNTHTDWYLDMPGNRDNTKMFTK
jgi:LruC domain-containing protein